MASKPLNFKYGRLLLDSSTAVLVTDINITSGGSDIKYRTLDDPDNEYSDYDLHNYTVSVSSLLPIDSTVTPASEIGYYDLLQKKQNDASIGFEFHLDVSTQRYLSGWGIISNLDMTGAIGNHITWKCDIAGNGTLTVNTSA